MRIDELQPALQSTIVGIADFAVEFGLSAQDVREVWSRGIVAGMVSTPSMVAAHTGQQQGANRPARMGESS